VLNSDAATGREHFNLVRDLPLLRRAKLGIALTHSSLAAITTMLRGPNEF
jgi:hypothetical protein